MIFSDLGGTLLNLQRSKKLTTLGVTNPVMGEYLWVRILYDFAAKFYPWKKAIDLKFESGKGLSAKTLKNRKVATLQ